MVRSILIVLMTLAAPSTFAKSKIKQKPVAKNSAPKSLFKVIINDPNDKQTEVSIENLNSGSDLPMPGSDWRCFLGSSDEKDMMRIFVKCISKSNHSHAFINAIYIYQKISALEIDALGGLERSLDLQLLKDDEKQKSTYDYRIRVVLLLTK